MHSDFAINELVCRPVRTHGDRVARAFLVEGEHLRDRLVALLNWMYISLLHMVMGMPVPIETGRVLWDPLCRCLEVHEKLFRKLPLNTKGLPAVIEGNHGLLQLAGHTTVLGDHVNAVLGPTRGRGDHEPLEGRGQEVHSRTFGGTLLLLLWGGVNFDDVI